ncbi:MAG: error-prone DNA polymerase [Candidatus Binatia bacterium]|nr:MAG: error-prone DNA polymerase [Candidatus Binatia bacterium]
MGYVELRCRSAFSFLRGASLPEDLVERAAALGYRALALGDTDGVYGAPRFHRAALAAGIRALVGCELRLFLPELGSEATLYLLVESRAGYRNLCRLLTNVKLRAPKGEGRAGWEDLEGHTEGLLCLAGGESGVVAAALRRRDPETVQRTVDRLRAFFSDRLFVDLQRHFDPVEERRNRTLLDLARHYRIPVVATNDVHYATPEGRKLADVLTCIREKTTLDAAGRLLERNAERHLKSPREMRELFSDLPEALAATERVAERCEFTLENLGYRFPDFPLPPGTSPAGYLRQLVEEGARKRYGNLSPRVRSQLEHELAIIEKLGLPGYFLIVWDIVRYCRERGILAQGRGSAANSAVCYALGITAVDPVGMDLLFERFLSEERGEWPDIDIDLPSGERREEVIQYVYRRYGERGAGMTANVITYRLRSAVREVGKVLGFSLEQVDRVARLLRRFAFLDETDELREQLSEGGIDPRSLRAALWLDLVSRIQNLPRHLGQHTGGMVLAAGRLDEVVPLEPAAMPGRVVVQWDKDDCADLGIIKVDLLGLGMMAVLQDSIALVREHEGVELDLAKLPPDDPKVYEMLRRADTIGVFQVESRAQMATLPRMKPERFYDLVVEVAIIRPGPIVGQMVHPYLRRRAGREPVTYPHPSLEPILARTLGVPLFQEQLLRIAMVAAGFSGGEAEELRRAMGFKRSVERMRAIEKRLREGMARNGIVGPAVEEIVRSITSFALYGFPESHAASFALLAYASAYLKVHHPAVFYCALLDNFPMGFYHPATLVQDARRRGVRVLPVDVNRSSWRCTVERCEGKLAVRLGLQYVQGLREEAGRKIEEGRPFRSVAEVVARCGLREEEAETLAEIGAFACFGLRRREALWQVAAVPRGPLFAGKGPAGPGEEVPLPEMTPLERTLADYRGTGLTVGRHVMAHLREELRSRGVVSAREIGELPDGLWVRTAGLVIVRQRPGTARGFCFLTLEDETGTSNAVVTPHLFRRYRTVLHTAPLLEVEGRLQKVDGVVHVRASRFRELALPPYVVTQRGGVGYRMRLDPEEAMPRSHDFR